MKSRCPSLYHSIVFFGFWVLGCQTPTPDVLAPPDATGLQEASSPNGPHPDDDAGAGDGSDAALTADGPDARQVSDGFDATICDPAKAPHDDPCVVSGANGIFVSPQGTDNNPGTPTAPLKSLAVAIGRAAAVAYPRVYLCNGVYSESVQLHTSVSLYGGITCGDGGVGYGNGTLSTISSAPNQIPLIIDGVDAAVSIEDMEFAAADASGQDDAGNGQSSIAALVNSSTVTFRRCLFLASNGVQGGDGRPTANYLGATAPDGFTSDGGLGGTGASITCANGSISFGGQGGGLESGSVGGEGGALPMPSVMPYLTGAGGSASNGSCLGLLTGSSGSGSTLAGAAPIALGVLSPSGWTPSAGGTGGTGGTGQGGGGGGENGIVGGMGGGAGGCGGAGGIGGGGGGGTIALISFLSHVDIDGCTLLTAIAGNGGRGGDGQRGQGGGASPEDDASIACPGGTGGNGGGGAGGAGGAGGVAVCALWSGIPPTGATMCGLGTAGFAGLGGVGAAGGANALGVASAGSSAGPGEPGAARAQLGLP